MTHIQKNDSIEISSTINPLFCMLVLSIIKVSIILCQKFFNIGGHFRTQYEKTINDQNSGNLNRYLSQKSALKALNCEDSWWKRIYIPISLWHSTMELTTHGRCVVLL
jgi:hypothetical protein